MHMHMRDVISHHVQSRMSHVHVHVHVGMRRRARGRWPPGPVQAAGRGRHGRVPYMRRVRMARASAAPARLNAVKSCVPRSWSAARRMRGTSSGHPPSTSQQYGRSHIATPAAPAATRYTYRLPTQAR
eukprot:3558315-Prymnesium_polylepis.1